MDVSSKANYDRRNKLHETALRIEYNDTITTFEEFLKIKLSQYIIKIFNH